MGLRNRDHVNDHRYGFYGLIAYAILVTVIFPLATFYQSHQTQQSTVAQEQLLVQGHELLLQIKSAQTLHAGTLTAIAAETREIEILAGNIRRDEGSQAVGNATVTQILKEAGAAVKQLETLEAEICVSVGCKP